MTSPSRRVSLSSIMDGTAELAKWRPGIKISATASAQTGIMSEEAPQTRGIRTGFIQEHRASARDENTFRYFGNKQWIRKIDAQVDEEVSAAIRPVPLSPGRGPRQYNRRMRKAQPPSMKVESVSACFAPVPAAVPTCLESNAVKSVVLNTAVDLKRRLSMSADSNETATVEPVACETSTLTFPTDSAAVKAMAIARAYQRVQNSPAKVAALSAHVGSGIEEALHPETFDGASPAFGEEPRHTTSNSTAFLPLSGTLGWGVAKDDTAGGAAQLRPHDHALFNPHGSSSSVVPHLVPVACEDTITNTGDVAQSYRVMLAQSPASADATAPLAAAAARPNSSQLMSTVLAGEGYKRKNEVVAPAAVVSPYRSHAAMTAARLRAQREAAAAVAAGAPAGVTSSTGRCLSTSPPAASPKASPGNASQSGRYNRDLSGTDLWSNLHSPSLQGEVSSPSPSKPTGGNRNRSMARRPVKGYTGKRRSVKQSVGPQPRAEQVAVGAVPGILPRTSSPIKRRNARRAMDVSAFSSSLSFAVDGPAGAARSLVSPLKVAPAPVPGSPLVSPTKVLHPASALQRTFLW